MESRRRVRAYDHRLVRLVRQSGDTGLATRLGVPRSTASGWLHRAPTEVVTAQPLDATADELRVRIAALQRRVRRLLAVLRIAIAVLRILQPEPGRLSLPNGCDKRGLLAAIDRARGVLGLRRLLGAVGLSHARLSAWRRAARGCKLTDQESCPATAPHGLTPEEVRTVREMVTAPKYRHVPTGCLALLAQRLGKVFASPSTWYRLVKERGWRRPRLRVHPQGPRVGVRAQKPNEFWHIDVTVIRLLDGSKAFVQAVIDNFSRRILAWRVGDKARSDTTAEILLEACTHLGDEHGFPKLISDQGCENTGSAVSKLVEQGLFERILALVGIAFSNSMIEAFWKSLKHNWLFLNQLDSVATVRRLVTHYVEEHNTRIPHSAHKGQTPDEMYFGTGDGVPEDLKAARAKARKARLEANRVRRCEVCA